MIPSNLGKGEILYFICPDSGKNVGYFINVMAMESGKLENPIKIESIMKARLSPKDLEA